jgi:DNA polymerase-3 subunit beta
MKVSVAQKNLRRALGFVERVIGKNVSLPILQNVVIKTEAGRVKLLGTNLEIGVTAFVGAKIEEVGEIAVPGRVLSDFINGINEDVVLLTTKNNSLFISSKNTKTQILGCDPKEYPIIPKVNNGVLVTLPSQTLKNAFLSVIDAVAVSETRPELSGVCMKFLPSHIVCAATDGFRLAEKVISQKPEQQRSIILPRATVAEVLRIAGDVEGLITIQSGDNQVAFTGEDFELVSRLIDGSYPDYTKLIPDKFVTKALVGKDDFEKNIKLAGLFSSSISDVKVIGDQKSISFVAKNSDRGEIETSVEALVKGDPFDVAINFRYLLDGLKVIPTDKVVIEFTGPGSPLVIRPAEEVKDFICLVMPLRT